MRYRLASFDFDGTLADSAAFFSDVLNDLASEFDFKPLTNREREELRGLPTREVLKRMRIPAWQLPRIAVAMRRRAARDRHRIGLFPGVAQLFAGLRRCDIEIAIVSSNATATIRAILGVELAGLVTCYACGASLFGKAAKLRTMLRKTGTDPAQAIYIGDETRDAVAAKEAGIDFGGVAWGYATREALTACSPDYLFESFEDLLKQLTNCQLSSS